MFVTAYGDLPLLGVDLIGGGTIVATADISLVGIDTISLNTGSTLKPVAEQGVDATNATGWDAAGGWLQIESGGGVGSLQNPSSTDLVKITFLSTGADPTPLYVLEKANICVEEVKQNDNTTSETWIDAAGDMSVGRIASLWLEACVIGLPSVLRSNSR